MNSPVKSYWRDETDEPVPERMDAAIVIAVCIGGGLMWWGMYEAARWIVGLALQ